MRPSFARVVCMLALGAALLLPGCKKKQVAVQTGSDGPQGNPVLPRAGTPIEGGGAIQNVRRAARRTVDLTQLANFSLAYFQYQTLNGQGPSSVNDIKDSLDANTIAAFNEGICVGVWNLRNPSAATIVAYVKDPDIYGTRVAATGDGKARRMNQQEFDAALKAK